MSCDCSQPEIRRRQRGANERKDLTDRLSRIEGQVRGIRAMVEEDRYCVDIMTQVSAVRAALSSFNKELLAAISEPACRRISGTAGRMRSMNCAIC